MQCAESLRLQAYFDGELDASSAAAMEGHLEHCAECRALLADLENLRAALRDQVEHPRAPAALRQRILESLERESAGQGAALGAGAGVTTGTDLATTTGRMPGAALGTMTGQGEPDPESAAGQTPSANRGRGASAGARWGWRGARGGLPGGGAGPRRSFLFGAASGALGTALAAAFAFVMVWTPSTPPVVDELVSAHIRSLMPAHLIDVVSTDQHTVKPWFSGHADVSPVVANFDKIGYTLVGGRADYLERQRAAVVVYQHGAHVINVFSWAWDGRRVPNTLSRNGYHLEFWHSGNLVYCAVSDAGWTEIQGLVDLLQGLGSRDTRG